LRDALAQHEAKALLNLHSQAVAVQPLDPAPPRRRLCLLLSLA
jgi:hypothetical protein